MTRTPRRRAPEAGDRGDAPAAGATAGDAPAGRAPTGEAARHLGLDPELEGRDPDGALLVAAVTDAEAFGRFYDRNQRAVTSYFQRRVACAHVSAELTAETFAEALAGLERFDPRRGSGRSWLFGIATNQFRQWLRRGRVERSALQRLGIALPPVTPDDVERIEAMVDMAGLVPQLRRALARLSPATRAAVQLRVVCQLPYAVIAERLGWTEVNARVRVARGLDSLACAIEDPS